MKKLYESFEIVSDPDMGLVAIFTFAEAGREAAEITGRDPEDGMYMMMDVLRDNIESSAEDLTDAGLNPDEDPDHTLKVAAYNEMLAMRSSLG